MEQGERKVGRDPGPACAPSLPDYRRSFTLSFPIRHAGTTSVHRSARGRQLAQRLFFFNKLSFFLSVLGLHCCAGFSLVAARKLLVAVASPVAEHRLQALGLQ